MNIFLKKFPISILLQKVILDSINKDDETFTGNGYISLSVIYAVFAIFNWLAPPVISMLGAKIAMLYGGVTYL